MEKDVLPIDVLWEPPMMGWVYWAPQLLAKNMKMTVNMAIKDENDFWSLGCIEDGLLHH